MKNKRNTKIALLSIILVLLCRGSVSAEAGIDLGQAYIGVILQSDPLPKLLTKHLRLKADQGLLIRNVQLDSPADKIGLERDDIIIGFEGSDVTDFEKFRSDIVKAGIGAKVKLDFT